MDKKLRFLQSNPVFGKDTSEQLHLSKFRKTFANLEKSETILMPIDFSKTFDPVDPVSHLKK